MALRENNDRNKPHISRSSKKRKFQQTVGRLIVFSGLLVSAVGPYMIQLPVR
jgi:hypothetical protein